MTPPDRPPARRVTRPMERCQRALAVSREGYWEHDLHSGQSWSSPGLLATLGEQAARALQQQAAPEEFIHPEDTAAYCQALARARTTGLTADYEVRMRADNGQWRWVRGRCQQWPGTAGRPVILAGTASDVDAERNTLQTLEAQQRALEGLVHDRTAGLQAALALAERRSQEAERANTAKSQFLAHMSHEIRTPLNGVLGLTELALRTPLSAVQQRYLEAAHTAGQSLLRVISDVLDLSRIESGRVELRPEPFDPVRALAESLRAVMPSAKRDAQVAILFDWVGDTPWVLGDEGCLRQIVTNLLANALKFTESGQVSLRGESNRQPDGHTRLTIEVADTGPGIPAHLRETIFLPFVQGDGGLARGHGGAGLGLAIASRLARAMQAQVRVDCPASGGSVFSVALTLPLADGPGLEGLEGSEALAASASDERHPPPTGRVGLAWLVYPHADTGGWMAKRLARLGWQTEVVLGLATAVARAEQTPAAAPPPDLVLLAGPALVHETSLAPLRAALPDAVIRLLVRPHWHHPLLDAECSPLKITALVAPLTPAQLARIGAPEPPPISVQPQGAGGPAATDRPEVLLVEDNAVNQLVGQEFLRALGLVVRVAADGEAALAACITHAPRLVLMDIEMPGMDGLVAARRLRVLQREGRWAGAPIVALTAHASAADRAACRAAGMDGVITKPLTLAALRKRLGRWVPLGEPDTSAPEGPSPAPASASNMSGW